MMTFKSSADLSRLHRTDPAHNVISTLMDNLKTEPATIALMQSHDIDNPLNQLWDSEDVTLEGVIQQQDMYLVVLQTDYDYGLVIVIPNDADWMDGELRQSIEQNLQH